MTRIEEQGEVELTGKSKLLSICIIGKDDDYMLDFRYRITTTINHIAHSLKQLKRMDEVEILVTDWGSHIPMAQTLNLSPEAAEITRFIYISQDIIQATQGGREDFNVPRALNVDIRRASGTYILISAADTLISQYSLESLLRFLKGEIPLSVELDRTFFLLPRLQVPWQFLERQPSLEEWDRYFLVSNKQTPLEPPAFLSFGGAGAFLMHRSMWHELRGMDELLSHWGWGDNDLGFRVSQNHPFLSLSGIGIILYHMGHPPTSRSLLAKIENPNIYNVNSQVNSENWGLADIDLDLQYPAAPSKIIPGSNPNSRKNIPIIPDTPQSQLMVFQSEIKNIRLIHSVKKSLISFIKKGWKIEEKEINALFLLAWYSNYRYPQRYLEFATGRTPASGIVAAGCPSVEIFKVDTWQGVSPPHTPVDLYFINENISYCGYLRFINGDIGTAIQRLRDSFIGPISFDLVFITDELLGDDIVKNITNLLPYLAPGGALVFFRCSRSSFESDWSKLQKKYPEYTYISCADHQTGMILNKSFDDVRNKYSRIEEVSFSTSWVIPAKIKGQILYIMIKIISNHSINKVCRKLIRNMR